MDTLKNLFSPPHLGGQDTEQQKTILQISSIAALLAGLFLGLVNTYRGFNHLGLSLFILAGVSAFTLWSIQRSKLMAPSFLLPLSALLVLTSNLVVGGSLQEPGALVYPVVIVFSSLLLGKRATLLFAGLSILSQAIVFFAVSSGMVSSAVGVQDNISGLIVTSLLIAITAGFLWIMLDSLEHSVKKVRTSEARWRSLVENAPITIINTNTQGDIQFTNRSTNISVSEMIGKPILDFVHMKENRRAVAISRKVLNTGKSAHFETIARYIEDREMFYSVSVGPIFGVEGEIEGLTFIILDITEKKQSENEIHRLNAELALLVQERTAQLETSNQELASLSYSISHDLRTPLRAIDGFSLALLEDYKNVLDEQGRNYLDRVRAASQHMGTLIDDLLRLSQIARQVFQRLPVNLSALVNIIASEFLSSYPERSVEVLIEPGLNVHGDLALLHIAIENLFKNAWTFTSLGKQARIEFGCREIDGLLTYFMRDNGMGFDMQYAAKLFQPFQHLHGNSELEGSGMGLAIVQRIIQKHGGKIWAEAQVNEGATFFFTLSPH